MHQIITRERVFAPISFRFNGNENSNGRTFRAVLSSGIVGLKL